MLQLPFHQRIHESLALGAMLAASVALHVAWIGNLALVRFEGIRNALAAYTPQVGSIGALYLFVLLAYVGVLAFATAWFHEKDCTHVRENVFWFFFASLFAFLFLTYPFLFELEVFAPAG